VNKDLQELIEDLRGDAYIQEQQEPGTTPENTAPWRAADALEDMLPVEQTGVCYCEEETEDRWLWDEETQRWRLEGSWNTSFILPEDLPRFCFNCGAKLDARGVASRGADTQRMDKLEGMRGDDCIPVQTWVFDAYFHKLSGAEMKVLMYIMRHTVNTRGEMIRIPLSQFTTGTAHGVSMDRGTGCATSAIKNAITSLEAKGLITVDHVGPNPNSVCNGYTLNTSLSGDEDERRTNSPCEPSTVLQHVQDQL